MKNYIPNIVVEHVENNLGIVFYENKMDKAWQTRNISGKFLTRSSWNLVRQTVDDNEDVKVVWCKGLNFKFSFLVWRIQIGKVLMVVLMHKWNNNINRNCGCCYVPSSETIEQLFL